VPVAFLLALACIVPARAATCPQEAQLRADPRWPPLDDEHCHHCLVKIVGVGRNGLLLWNGAPVTEARLADYLGDGAERDPSLVTMLWIGVDADCALLARVVAAIETHAECDGEYCPFGLAPDAPPRRRARR
jgi:hypothetical protein